MDYQKLIKKARHTNLQRDKDEREMGFIAAREDSPFMQLRTAMMAIECGIKTDDWNAIAEAQDMLMTLHEQVSGGERYGN